LKRTFVKMWQERVDRFYTRYSEATARSTARQIEGADPLFDATERAALQTAKRAAPIGRPQTRAFARTSNLKERIRTPVARSHRLAYSR